MVENYSVKSLLQKGIDILGEGEYFNPLLDSQVILCFVLNVDKIYLYTHGNDEVSHENVDKFLKLIEKRKEEVFIGGAKEGLALYVKRFFPGLFSRIIRKAKVR